jgi:NSS family neurotransmitter:Na+ symporter
MERESFGSRFTVIMALAGSAIGLGNIWRFPYMVGEYGGAAFILIYIISSLCLSLPIFISEVVIGRRARANTVGAMKRLAPGTPWKWLGYLNILTVTIVVSYYSVVGGWSIEYLFKSCTLTFLSASATDVSGMFSTFMTSTWSPLLCHFIFLLCTCVIVVMGVKKGIESFSKVMMPILFLLIILIAVNSVLMPGAKGGIDYLVNPDFSKITFKTCAYAIGQSFFSLSLGMGIVLTYGSYVGKEENLFVSGVWTALADTIFALLAGFAIMPAVFSGGIQPNAGPGLVFETLPNIFVTMGAVRPVISAVVSILFFLSVLVAALTSSISLVEVVASFMVEELHMKRIKSVALIFVVAFIIGALCSLSFGPLSGVKIMGKNIFSFLDSISSNVLMTLGGLLISVFAGWVMKKQDVRDEFTNSGSISFNNTIFSVVYFLIRYFGPATVGVVFIANIIF